MPLLKGAGGHAGKVLLAEDGAIAVDWRLAGGRLELRANLSPEVRTLPPLTGELIYRFAPEGDAVGNDQLAGHSVVAALAPEQG